MDYNNNPEELRKIIIDLLEEKRQLKSEVAMLESSWRYWYKQATLRDEEEDAK